MATINRLFAPQGPNVRCISPKCVTLTENSRIKI